MNRWAATIPTAAAKAAPNWSRRRGANPFASRRRRGLGIASARAGNVIGGGDWAEDRLIPDCIRALKSGQAIGIRNPASIASLAARARPVVRISRSRRAADRQSRRPMVEAWNFGPADEDAQPVALDRRSHRQCLGRIRRAGKRSPAMNCMRRSISRSILPRRGSRLDWSQGAALGRRRSIGPSSGTRAFSAASRRLTLTEQQIDRYSELEARHSMTVNHCRFCGAPVKQTFVDLGRSPLANSFLSEEDIEPRRDLLSVARLCLRTMPARSASGIRARRKHLSATISIFRPIRSSGCVIAAIMSGR